jgi:hypothetical protein
MATDHAELHRLAGKIIADDSKKRQRLHVYGWSALVAFATNFLEAEKATMGGDADAGAGGPDDDHPLTAAQVKALDDLFAGGDVKKVNAATRAALERRGLIDDDGELTQAGVAARAAAADR